MKFFLSFFQNDPFYITKWAILGSKMIHSGEQNGPFPIAE